jgi:hypothetical protein
MFNDSRTKIAMPFFGTAKLLFFFENGKLKCGKLSTTRLGSAYNAVTAIVVNAAIPPLSS